MKTSSSKSSGRKKDPVPFAKGSGSAGSGLAIGAHVTGGLRGAVKKAQEIGAQSMQIFIGSPQSWAIPEPAPADFSLYKQQTESLSLGPTFVHGNYLVNLGAELETNLEKSRKSLRTALRLADACGATGLIFHPGSAGKQAYSVAMERVVGSLEYVLEGYDGGCRLLLEVCAGQGETIGCKFSQFKDILSAMGGDRRLGVCWDTCHLFNAGYDVSTAKGLASTVSEFETLVGFEWLYVIHANDSKTPLGARRDRHENIGEGYIGQDGFKRMLHHPNLKHLPWILEVPGFEKKGPDRRNIELLHRLASSI